MPQCKKDGCREQAIHHRRWGHKRYCEEHGHAYADRRDKTLVARAKMPDCESGISPSCDGKVRPSRQSEGYTVCRWCEEERCKQQQFDDARTVDEIKDWIRKYTQ